MALAAAMSTPSRAETLRWKFKAGDVLHYTTEQKMVSVVKAGDREQKSTSATTIDISWTVKSVTSTGAAEILQRTDRVRARIEAPGIVPVEFDSKNPQSDTQGPLADVVRQLKTTAGSELTFKIKPNGEIEDIKFSEQTLKTMRESAGPGSPEGDVNEGALKDLLLRSSPPPFPEGPVEPGKSWSSKQLRFPTPMGTMVLDNRFTFQGPDPKSPKLALVGVEGKVTLEPAEGSGLTAQIRKQESKGNLVFDTDAGRIVSTRSTQTIDLAISLMDQKFEQTNETTSTMTLAP
jgi:hypothetical protein